ncbi:MAG: D-aminoacyl-tRNA deacylase [Solirubrobacterales bacterium]
MKAVVQRVSSAAVSVRGSTVSEIGPGLLVLLGVAKGDGPEEAERMAGKLLRLRVFPDSKGRMSEDLGGREILCVSQFTLCGDTSKGNRPSFVEAALPDIAEPLYLVVCERIHAQRGVFGEDMEVALVGDGPVTVLIDV